MVKTKKKSKAKVALNKHMKAVKDQVLTDDIDVPEAEIITAALQVSGMVVYLIKKLRNDGSVR